MSQAEKYGDERLGDLKPGQEGLVTGLSEEAGQRERLMELGFVEGCLVRVLGGRDPLLVQLGESRLGLSRRLASGVEILCLCQEAPSGREAVPGDRGAAVSRAGAF